MGKEVFSACGLYCGVCGIYLATQSNNTLLAEKLAQFYQVPPEAIRCHGCNSDTVFVFCKSCRIKECAASKHIAGCHECSSYPCDNIKQFPIPLGKKNIMRCVPFRRAFGTEVWEQEELRRYCCPRCQTPFFRGAKKCAHCKQEFVSE